MAIPRYAASLLITVWITVTLTFFLLRVLPGDAITAQLSQAGAADETIQFAREQLGLEKPIGEQYIRYLTALLRGNLGVSLVSNQPVDHLITQRIQPTLMLTVSAMTLASVAGVAVGIAAAFDFVPGQIARSVMYLSISTPIYWTGTLAILLFSVHLGWFPSSGTGRLENLILPTAVLGFNTMGEIARIVQVNILETLQGQFVLTARSRGLPEARILLWHVFRVGLIPVVTVIALQTGFLLSGTVITESLFVRPGIGRLLLDSTIQQDYPVVQGIVVISAIGYSLLNTCADILYYFIDPRLRS